MKTNEWYSSEEFEKQYTYDGELGALWSADKTVFRLWAPTAESVFLNLYRAGEADTEDLQESIPMQRSEKGVWSADKLGDLAGTYYTYTVKQQENFGGELVKDVCDPYAKALGVNGNRAMVVNLGSTDPKGWGQDGNPHAAKKATEAIVYEAHVRDLTVHASAGILAKGKFGGLLEQTTIDAEGEGSVLDYLTNLGVTHLQLLPIFDYGSVDERECTQYNWGYDPKNFFAPEGSYATDAYDGSVRIRELKALIKELHNRGLGVIMDVVFNHVYDGDSFCFNNIVPGYFSRKDQEGNYSNGSFCGNDTASERSMVRKLIVDNLLYWAKEYHIDGFRFDLVGLIDVDTIREAEQRLHAFRPDILLYGEGWSMDTHFSKKVCSATQNYAADTPNFGYFSDTIRNVLRGNNFDLTRKGFVNGGIGLSDAVKSNLMGNPHWAQSPSDVVNYISCHDDLTLYDRYASNDPGADRATLIAQCRLAAALVFASEGIVLFGAGEEILRRKINPDGTMNHNTYNCGDAINAIDWGCLREAEYRKQRDYYRKLIAFRKAHPVFALDDPEEITKRFRFYDVWESEAFWCIIDCTGIEGETVDKLVLFFNPDQKEQVVKLPGEVCGGGQLHVCLSSGELCTKQGEEGLAVSAVSAVFLDFHCKD